MPHTIWNQDVFIKAWNFASQAHRSQVLPGSNIPYLNHLGNVAMEVMTLAALDDRIKSPDLLVQCALLHDTVEDTDVGYAELETEFGKAVAEGVLALSKDLQLPTKAEQMQDSLARILLQPAEIAMVKMADRITNLQPPPHHWKPEKISNYRDEATLILETLGTANQALANRLKEKITHYQIYCQ